MATRVDVKERLEDAALEELYNHGNYVLLVSKRLVDEMAGKASGPVALAFEVTFGSAIIDAIVTDLSPGAAYDGE